MADFLTGRAEPRYSGRMNFLRLLWSLGTRERRIPQRCANCDVRIGGDAFRDGPNGFCSPQCYQDHLAFTM